MTETRIAYQAGFVGLADDQVAGDIVERCRVMLLEEPATREDYTTAYIRYLARYCGLDDAMKPWWTSTELLEYLRNQPSFRTIALRCQELMRPGGVIRAPREVEQLRQRQRTQGRVR